MTRYFAKSLFICTVLIASLVSTTVGLSLEELSLEIQQLKRNNVELSLEIRQLRQDNKELSLEIRREKQNDVDQRNSAFSRTCKELHQADPTLQSGMYWIDPDGQGLGDDPIYVHCEMTTGKTSVLHDSEEPIDVGHCAGPGCYNKTIKYSASWRQMITLAELSSECRQSIRYDCNYAPLETNGVAQAWWNDRNGVAQYFWSGNNNSVHKCQCGIDKNCIESYYLCNCDSVAPFPLNDNGVITDKIYLPITRLNFGRTQLESSSGVHTLGRFECTGQVSVSGVPKSCSDLWKVGHILSGIYSVMGSNYVETVYCDFAKLPHEKGFQTRIGYSDVKSLPVYFYVQKTESRNVTGIVPFELTRFNIGGAMNASSGIFTAPRSGLYSFQLSGIGKYPALVSASSMRMAFMLNDNEIGSSITYTQDMNSYHSYTLHSMLDLNEGDQVWTSIQYLHAGACLFDHTDFQYTHFTGNLLQENVASYFNLTRNLS